MHCTGQVINSFLRAFLLVFIGLCLIAGALLDANGQNAVPPTAAQAAKMPQFATRLGAVSSRQPLATPKDPARFAHPPLPRASFKNTGAGRLDRGPLDSVDIYDNGPINGNTDAWAINFGFIVSDSFNFADDNNPITGMTFAMWLFPGDTLTSAELSITSGENGGTSYFNETVTFVQGSCTGNVYGFNICTETTTFTGPTLNNGTYWVNLQNASVPSGDPIYWDENSGPSSASENSVGSIPSEAFTVLGNATTTSYYNNYSCPPRPAGFHEVRDFSGHAGPSALAIDTAGKLYGTFANGGSHGAGLLYDLAQRAGHWMMNSLYNFLGGSSGYSPGNVFVGPGGAIFGSAAGGDQTCGYNGASCGLIYEARPNPAACAAALCSWNVTTIYEFTGNTDAWGGTISGFDAAGNLYGISENGGAYRAGAVFELSPSQGGWTEKILYSFTGDDDSRPSSLLVGLDGNIYGTAFGYGSFGYCYEANWCGFVFQLVPSENGWTKNIIYSFTGGDDGFAPGGLIQDSSGNLYGFSIWNNFLQGRIFVLQPYGGGWLFNTIYSNQHDCGYLPPNLFHALAMDAAGHLYASEGGSYESCDSGGCNVWNCGEVLEVPSGRSLISGNADIFSNLTSDANGNLYGTTNECGNGFAWGSRGMVWEYSP